MRESVTVIDAIGTANPPYTRTQTSAAQFMLGIDAISEHIKKRIPRIYDHSGIASRYSCVRDYVSDMPEYELFPRNASLSPPPTTLARNALYQIWAPKLAQQAATRAMDEARVDAADVSHLVVVSCTGFFAPGVDVCLIRSLGLAANTPRTNIGFMGCCAAFNGLKAAHAICQAEENARVLVVCVELCTLHFQIEDTMESAVVNAIFSDGAAAAIVSACNPENAKGRIAVRYFDSLLDSGCDADMTWSIGDTGFLMSLSPRIPDRVSELLPAYVDGFLRNARVTLQSIDTWAIHPGGRQIVDKAKETLGLTGGQIHDSYDVLHDFGNMSSPTILFILKRIMDRPLPDGANCVAMAFGPGLTIESGVFTRWR